MKIKIRDKVRSLGGVEGEIVQLDVALRAAMVRVPGNWRGTDIVSIPLARLKVIDDYASSPRSPKPPRGPTLTPAT